MKRILILNGSIQGSCGNSHRFLLKFVDEIKKLNTETHFNLLSCSEITENPKLSREQKLLQISELFENHDAFVFATGTYWDSWGSPMQAWLELMTPLEGTSAILGKPVSVLVTMHSVGGKEVLSRLQGVLSTMGFLVPPMAHMAYSLQNHLLASSVAKTCDFAEDFWNLSDLEIMAHNLLQALSQKARYRSWEVDRKDPQRIWF